MEVIFQYGLVQRVIHSFQSDALTLPTTFSPDSNTFQQPRSSNRPTNILLHTRQLGLLRLQGGKVPIHSRLGKLPPGNHGVFLPGTLDLDIGARLVEEGHAVPRTVVV